MLGLVKKNFHRGIFFESWLSNFLRYSETLPYGHLIITATFSATEQNSHAFSCKKPSLMWSAINMAKFFCPIGVRINGVPLYHLVITLSTIQSG